MFTVSETVNMTDAPLVAAVTCSLFRNSNVTDASVTLVEQNMFTVSEQ